MPSTGHVLYAEHDSQTHTGQSGGAVLLNTVPAWGTMKIYT